jgi:hypothetical protein
MVGSAAIAAKPAERNAKHRTVAFSDIRMPAAHQIIGTSPGDLHEDAGEEAFEGIHVQNHIFMQVCVDRMRPIMDLLGCLKND